MRKACACGHGRELHLRAGRGRGGGCAACGLGRCSRFELPAVPPLDDDQATQLALWEEHAHQRARIFDELVRAGSHGLTSVEVQERTSLNPNSVRGRLSEMEAEGTVARRGRSVIRGATGRPMAIYLATALGKVTRELERAS